MKASRQLAVELKQAKDALTKLKQQRDNHRNHLRAERVAPLETQITQVKRQIETEVATAYPYADFDDIESRIRVLTRELNEAKVAETKSTRTLIGQTVQQWRKTRYGEGRMVKGEIGVIDVYDGTNIGLKKIASYRKPEVGGLFIRNIKKDGTLGLTPLATVPEDTLPGGWYPLGVDPNNETAQ